jgi:sulfide:quinone oxidoreductase
MTAAARITVVGAGFAALTGLRRLRQHLPAAEITLVAPVPEFVYLPSLIWVPFGLRNGEDLRHDLRPVLEALRVNYVQAHATGLSPDGRTLFTDGGDIENDALLIASGGRFIRKPDGTEHTLTLCAGIDSAEQIGTRLRAMKSGTIALGFGANPQEPAAMRGGPMFELLFGLDRWLRKQGKRDTFQLVFFNAALQPGKRLGEKAVQNLLAQMRSRGIEARLGHKPIRFESGSVTTEAGSFPADLVLFMPGMTGPSWIEQSSLPLSAGGFVRADTSCQVGGFERVYVAGDAGSYPGPEWMPKQAHLADLQAAAAAENIARNLDGKAAAAVFRPELVCIIDTLEKGILVYRDEKRGFVLPPLRPMHWAKRYFEKYYLKRLLDTKAA